MKIEIDEVLKLVRDEPELPGDIPPDLMKVFSNMSIADICRETVRMTKRTLEHRLRERYHYRHGA